MFEDFTARIVDDKTKKAEWWPTAKRRVEKITVIKGYLAVHESSAPLTHPAKLTDLVALDLFKKYKFDPLPASDALHDPAAPKAKHLFNTSLAADLRFDPIAANMEFTLKFIEDLAHPRAARSE